MSGALDEPRRWTSEHPDGPRIDTDGVGWYACDRYPTFYRWENGELYTRTRHGNWKDEEIESEVSYVCPNCGYNLGG